MTQQSISKISKIAVVGAGNMGSGIAQKYAAEGYPVRLLDSSQELADKGKAKIEKLLIEGLDKKLFTPEDVDAILGRVTAQGDLGAASDCDLVVEAVFEDLAVKKAVFEKLDTVCAPTAVLATNTSSFLVAEVAAACKRPERVVGLHYFYHPAKNRLVEVIGHQGSSAAAIEAATVVQERIGKTAITSTDAPGFIVNRFFVPWLNEAVRLHEEGIGIATIDAVAKGAFGIGMGPFELMNVTGVPITQHAAQSLAAKLGAFYAPASSIGMQCLQNAPWDLGGEVDASQADRITERLLGVVFHVCLALVSEGVGTLDDVDIGARVGLRWPSGPFEMMNNLGLDKVVALVQAVEKRYGLAEPKALAAQRDSKKPFSLERVRLVVKDGIGTILVNRPDSLNALDPETVRQLDERFSEAESRSDVRGIVLAGSGKAFVAGADVKFFVDKMRGGDVPSIVRFADHGQKLFRRIEQCKKRVVCRLHGMALGGGAELALACHVIVATPKSTLAFPETGIGIYPGLGGTQRLTRRVGKGLARYLIYSGNTLSGKELGALELAWKVVEPEDLEGAVRAALTEAPVQKAIERSALPKPYRDVALFLGAVSILDLLNGSLTLPGGAEVLEIAKRIRRKAPRAVERVEQLTELAEKGDLDAGLAAETEGLRSIFASRDALEGMTALLERRRAAFTGQ